MRAVTGLWRWRHNPVCRATDLTEGWVALVALVLLCVAAPLAGLLVGAAADASLQRTAAEQQRERHATTARVVAAPGAEAAGQDAGGRADRPLPATVVARWTGPDGTVRTGSVSTGTRTAALDPGDAFRIWTDTEGLPVNQPLSAGVAREHAVLAGAGTALGAAALVEGARLLVVRRLVRRRYTLLDREWARAGPDWGRTGAGG
ncbi:hypothetical protein [Streptomyces sp. NPDC047928]|uniref:Rv1733c family protein n=1 Tax=unclassified Streptomyces TaxID=2593676 RepID=UPI0037218100